jgi:hypothetical protein
MADSQPMPPEPPEGIDAPEMSVPAVSSVPTTVSVAAPVGRGADARETGTADARNSASVSPPEDDDGGKMSWGIRQTPRRRG